ncbi:hypothetical protein BH24PSE2_BH24PSE2_24210 [soil metagenome]
MSFDSADDYREIDAAIRALKEGAPLATWRGGEYDETALELLVRNRTGIISDLRRRGEWDEMNAQPTTPPIPPATGEDLMRDAGSNSTSSAESLMRAAARRS